MLTANESIIETLGRYKHEIGDRFSVESLAVFGSVSRGSAGPESDVDILSVIVPPRLFFSSWT